MSMRVAFFSIWAVCLFRTASAENSPSPSLSITTFDQFIGTKTAATPEPSELDSSIWSFAPDEARGVLSFNSTEVVKAEKIRSLAPGYYAIHEPQGAALALRPGASGIEAWMRINLLNAKQRPDQLIVSYRASIPRIDASTLHSSIDGSPSEIAKVEFSWSTDGSNSVSVKEGDATFMSNVN